MPKNYSFHPNCPKPPPEETPQELREIGFPDDDDEIHEWPCMTADGEVLLLCRDKGGHSFGLHAMKFKGIGLFLKLDVEQARAAGRALLQLAEDLEARNAKSMVA
jgi:hypothetical protein